VARKPRQVSQLIFVEANSPPEVNLCRAGRPEAFKKFLGQASWIEALGPGILALALIEC
jgi:hypothetical protein